MSDLGAYKKLSEEARAVSQSATPGPWTTNGLLEIVSPDKRWLAGGGSDEPVIVNTKADADFIAAARQVVPALADALDSVVARLERLEAQRDEALALHQEWTSGEGLTVCARCASLAPDPPPGSIFSDTAWPCATVRVLSRTEDGTASAFWRDKVTGESCPRRGKELCTITDKEHRHVASHMWRTEDGTNG